MSMSTCVVLLRDASDPTYKKYLAVFLACREAGTSLPQEIDDYFGGTNDPEMPLQVEVKAREYHGDMKLSLIHI